MSTVRNAEAYDLLKEGSTTTVGRKIKKNFSTNKTNFTSDEKPKLAPWNNTQLFLYRLIKIHKPDTHLSPMVSYIGTCCHMLPGSLHNILSPFGGNNNFSVKIQTAH